MAVHVADVELTAPQALQLQAGTSHVLMLVRSHGMPIGVIRTDATDALGAEQLRTLIESELPIPRSSTPPPAAPPTSVVVCTRERPLDLERCLAALQPLARRGHELIVVDNAPATDGTRVVTGRYRARYMQEPRPGLSYARNCGLRAARHPVVAFTDDDAVPDDRWLDAIAASFTNSSVMCVTGVVLPLELRTDAQQAFEQYASHRRTFESRTFTRRTLSPSAAGAAGIGANMAVRREKALALGGFDLRLGAGSRTCAAEENDLFARILDDGGTIAYNPAALVWHRHRETDAELEECVFGYGVGVYAFLAKRVIEHHDVQALATAARWFAGPFLRAAGQRLRGQPTTPIRLLALEAAGAIAGPFRFIAARRRAAEPVMG